MFDRYMIFLVFAIMTGAAALIVIPKAQYKKFLLYSIFLGGNGDAVLSPIFSKMLHLTKYKNMGPFDILGLFSFWTPITWMFAFSIFFFLLPRSRVAVVPYILTWTALSFSVGIVLQSLGLFEYIGIGRYIMPVVFLLWFSLSAWIYVRWERLELK